MPTYKLLRLAAAVLVVPPFAGDRDASVLRYGARERLEESSRGGGFSVLHQGITRAAHNTHLSHTHRT